MKIHERLFLSYSSLTTSRLPTAAATAAATVRWNRRSRQHIRTRWNMHDEMRDTPVQWDCVSHAVETRHFVTFSDQPTSTLTTYASQDKIDSVQAY